MKRHFILFFAVLIPISIAFAKNVTPASDIPTYYQQVEGKSGQQLFDAIHNVSNVGFSTLGYNGLWTAYAVTDCQPGTNIIWDMYSDHCDFVCGGPKQGHNYSKECDGYNREHSIPKSWFGGSTSGMGCDIFHLVPTDGWVNNKRGNLTFGEVGNADYTSHNGSKVGPNTVAGYSGTVFEPIDEFKGDFARGYLGTMIKWEHQNMSQGEGSSIFTSSYTQSGGYGLTSYGIRLLLKWHREDPVSQKEIDRNNGIQQTQGNRNPFIDYPYLVEYIWGVKAGQTVHLADLVSAYDADFIPEVSDGHREAPTDYLMVDTSEENTVVLKYIINGRVLIEVDGHVYDVLGQEVR